MVKLFKRFIKKTYIFYILQNWLWEKNGKPIPPPHTIKQRTLKNYAKKYRLRILVETGTYYGEMVDAMKNIFDKIYSVELSTDLYEKAKAKFRNKTNVQLIQGDSGIELGKIMTRIGEPALFWLDGHYSGGITVKGTKLTPIYEELIHILSFKDIPHIIIIDDVHCFGDNSDYPSLDELIYFIKSRKPDMQVTIQDNMFICIN